MYEVMRYWDDDHPDLELVGKLGGETSHYEGKPMAIAEAITSVVGDQPALSMG